LRRGPWLASLAHPCIREGGAGAVAGEEEEGIRAFWSEKAFQQCALV
jgi:hypothetical protein